MLTPAKVKIIDRPDDDQRIGNLLGQDVKNPRVAILGFPVDDGVVKNGGRAGARQAPDVIRKHLYALTPPADEAKAFKSLLKRTVDLGNVKTVRNLASSQKRLGEIVADLLAKGTVPIILGGGHETSYGHFLGYVGAERSVSIQNFDAHPDVRPATEETAHSGSSFSLAMDHTSGLCERYSVSGLVPWSASPQHVKLIESRGGKVRWSSEVSHLTSASLFTKMSSPHMVSFDMDVVRAIDAPGVSAPTIGGIQAITWLDAWLKAGQSPQVSSVDLVEVNPKVDVDERTTKLAAVSVWYFLRGMIER